MQLEIIFEYSPKVVSLPGTVGVVFDFLGLEVLEKLAFCFMTVVCRFLFSYNYAKMLFLEKLYFFAGFECLALESVYSVFYGSFNLFGCGA